MLGHELLTALVTQRLRERVPVVMADRASKKKPELPVTGPETLHVYPHFVPAQEVGGFPCLMVEELDTNPRFTTRQVGSDGSQTLFEFRYVFRVNCFVRGTDYKVTAYRQKYMATVLRMALLERLSYYVSDSEKVIIDPLTFRESFSDVNVTEGDAKFLAGHYAEFELVSTETLQLSGMPDELAAVLTAQTGLMEKNSAEPIPPTLTDPFPTR